MSEASNRSCSLCGREIGRLLQWFDQGTSRGEHRFHVVFKVEATSGPLCVACSGLVIADAANALQPHLTVLYRRRQKYKNGKHKPPLPPAAP